MRGGKRGNRATRARVSAAAGATARAHSPVARCSEADAIAAESPATVPVSAPRVSSRVKALASQFEPRASSASTTAKPASSKQLSKTALKTIVKKSSAGLSVAANSTMPSTGNMTPSRRALASSSNRGKVKSISVALELLAQSADASAADVLAATPSLKAAIKARRVSNKDAPEQTRVKDVVQKLQKRILAGFDDADEADSAAAEKGKQSIATISEACCSECSATSTSLWRRNEEGNVLCNACGIRPKRVATPSKKKGRGSKSVLGRVLVQYDSEEVDGEEAEEKEEGADESVEESEDDNVVGIGNVKDAVNTIETHKQIKIVIGRGKKGGKESKGIKAMPEDDEETPGSSAAAAEQVSASSKEKMNEKTTAGGRHTAAIQPRVARTIEALKNPRPAKDDCEDELEENQSSAACNEEKEPSIKRVSRRRASTRVQVVDAQSEKEAPSSNAISHRVSPSTVAHMVECPDVPMEACIKKPAQRRRGSIPKPLRAIEPIYIEDDENEETKDEVEHQYEEPSALPSRVTRATSPLKKHNPGTPLPTLLPIAVITSETSPVTQQPVLPPPMSASKLPASFSFNFAAPLPSPVPQAPTPLKRVAAIAVAAGRAVASPLRKSYTATSVPESPTSVLDAATVAPAAEDAVRQFHVGLMPPNDRIVFTACAATPPPAAAVIGKRSRGTAVARGEETPAGRGGAWKRVRVEEVEEEEDEDENEKEEVLEVMERVQERVVAEVKRAKNYVEVGLEDSDDEEDGEEEEREAAGEWIFSLVKGLGKTIGLVRE